jgi:hypothetical protein
MKKHYYLIVDTETTQKNTVADFGAVIMDRQGNIVEQFGVLLDGHFGKVELFHDKLAPAESFWSTMMLHRRKKHYDQLLADGQRSICSAQLVNLWLTRIKAQYNPVVTAYNIAFDWGKCQKTGINLGIFENRFCLMKKAQAFFVNQDYIDFCHANGFVTAKLRKPSTTADTMAKYILGTDLADEPHTALEDARDYEAPILTALLSQLSRKKLLAL